MKEETTKTSTTTATGGPVASHHVLSPLGLGILSVVLGLLAPPIGLLVAVTAIYKAGQKAVRSALILGIVGLIAAAGSSAYYVWVYYDRHSDINSKAYTYDNFENYLLGGGQKGFGISFSRPSAFTDLAGFYKTTQQVALAHNAIVPGLKNGVIAGEINAQSAVPAGTIDKAFIQHGHDLFDNASNSVKEYSNFETVLTQFIQLGSYPNTYITFRKPTNFTSNSVKSNAWQWNYDATTVFKDNSKAVYQGKVVYAIGKKRLYFFSLSALDKNWTANSSSWQNVLNSIKIDQ